MRKTVFKAICINEYVKNIRLQFCSQICDILKKFFHYFPQKFLGIYTALILKLQFCSGNEPALKCGLGIYDILTYHQL